MILNKIALIYRDFFLNLYERGISFTTIILSLIVFNIICYCIRSIVISMRRFSYDRIN